MKSVTKKKLKDNVYANGVRCTAKNCQNKYPTKNLSFFGYPADLSKRKMWIKNCGIENLVGPDSIVKINLKVCGIHFAKNMFLNPPKNNRLLPNAIPTIFNNSDNSQSSSSGNKSNETVEGSTLNYDTRIIKASSNLLNTKDEPKTSIECKVFTKTSSEVYACSIPVCVYSTDKLNENINFKPKAIAIFCASIDNVKKWSSFFGVSLTAESKVCEKHFKSEDIISRDIFIPTSGVAKEKRLKPGAMPIRKYVGPIKRSSVNNDSEDTSIKKTRKYSSDISKTTSKTGDLPKEKNILCTEIGPSTSTVNQISNSNTELINSLSNDKSESMNSSMTKNAQSNLEKTLVVNNSLSISSQPSVQQNKQTLFNESSKVTTVIKDLKKNMRPVNKSSITSINNSMLNNLKFKIGQMSSKKLVDNSLSITVEKNVNQSKQVSATQSAEVAKRTSEMKSICINNKPKTTSIDVSTVRCPEVIDLSLESKPIYDELQTSVNGFQSNFEQPFSKSSSNNVLPTTLQLKSNLKKTPADNLIPNTRFSKCVKNKEEILPTHKVSGSLPSYTIIARDLINNKITLSKTDPSKNVSSKKSGITIQDTRSTLSESNTEIDFLNVFKKVLLPSPFWKSFYNSIRNSLVFIQQDEVMEPIKRVYFHNSFVPIININCKQYEYKKAVRTKVDLEKLLEEINGIEICLGYGGYFHEKCIGYIKNISERIEVCRYCKQLVEGKYIHKTDMAIISKTNTIEQFKKKISGMKIWMSNARECMHIMKIEGRK